MGKAQIISAGSAVCIASLSAGYAFGRSAAHKNNCRRCFRVNGESTKIQRESVLVQKSLNAQIAALKAENVSLQQRLTKNHLSVLNTLNKVFMGIHSALRKEGVPEDVRWDLEDANAVLNKAMGKLHMEKPPSTASLYK